MKFFWRYEELVIYDLLFMIWAAADALRISLLPTPCEALALTGLFYRFSDSGAKAQAPFVTPET